MVVDQVWGIHLEYEVQINVFSFFTIAIFVVYIYIYKLNIDNLKSNVKSIKF